MEKNCIDNDPDIHISRHKYNYIHDATTANPAENISDNRGDLS